jgi:hypothetical protein
MKRYLTSLVNYLSPFVQLSRKFFSSTKTNAHSTHSWPKSFKSFEVVLRPKGPVLLPNAKWREKWNLVSITAASTGNWPVQNTKFPGSLVLLITSSSPPKLLLKSFLLIPQTWFLNAICWVTKARSGGLHLFLATCPAIPHLPSPCTQPWAWTTEIPHPSESGLR